jgi:hypothetical protein
MSSGYVGQPFAQKTVTIDISESTTISSIVDTEQFNQYAFVMPAVWSAADITFQGAYKADDTFVAILDEAGAAVTVTGPAANEALSMDEATMRYLRPWRFLKLVSSAGQAADRDITLQLSME